MALATRVIVYDRRIVHLIQRGDGKRWIHGQAKKIEGVARQIAPFRTGRLAASHVTLPTTGSNQYSKVYRVTAMAPYARFVHEGTGIFGPLGRPIYKPRGMVIPGMNPNPRVRVYPLRGRNAGLGVRYSRPMLRRGKGGTFVHETKGQRAQPWLQRAADIALGL